MEPTEIVFLFSDLDIVFSIPIVVEMILRWGSFLQPTLVIHVRCQAMQSCVCTIQMICVYICAA